MSLLLLQAAENGEAALILWIQFHFVCWAVSAQECSDEGAVKLSDGDRGRVEVCISRGWRAVCGNNWYSPWGPMEALVTCRQLGFNCKFKIHDFIITD